MSFTNAQCHHNGVIEHFHLLQKFPHSPSPLNLKKLGVHILRLEEITFLVSIFKSLF